MLFLCILLLFLGVVFVHTVIIVWCCFCAVWLSTHDHTSIVSERLTVPHLPVNPDLSTTRNQVNLVTVTSTHLRKFCECKGDNRHLPVQCHSSVAHSWEGLVKMVTDIYLSSVTPLLHTAEEVLWRWQHLPVQCRPSVAHSWGSLVKVINIYLSCVTPLLHAAEEVLWRW